MSSSAGSPHCKGLGGGGRERAGERGGEQTAAGTERTAAGATANSDAAAARTGSWRAATGAAAPAGAATAGGAEGAPAALIRVWWKSRLA